MASKHGPGSAKDTLGQQGAALRRAAAGKRFVGDRAAQAGAARRGERDRVERLAEIDAAHRRADRLGVPVEAVLAELVEDFFRLARSLALAPLRIAQAIRSSRRTASSRA
jgi:hypothetical protein